MDSWFEFVSGEWVPDLAGFALNFVQNIEVNLAMKGGVERIVESIPQTIGRKAWRAIIFDSFSSWELSLLDPIH